MNFAHKTTYEVLEPLCEATRKMFRPLNLSPYDRLRVELDDEGENFIVRAYGYIPPKLLSIRVNSDKKSASRGRSLIFTIRPGERGNGSHKANVGWLDRIPEKKAHGRNGWWLAGTDTTALIINAIWPKEQLDFDSEARILFDFLITRFMVQTELARKRANFFATREPPETSYIDCAELPLATYQHVGVDTTINQDGQALFMEQGTGKSAIVISRIMNECQKHAPMMRVLIACPKNVRANWKNEFFRFATIDGKVSVLRGDKLNRVKTLVEAQRLEDDCAWSATVCSYEAVDKTYEAMLMIPWDLVVLDESHYIKSTRTKRFKRSLQLRDLAKQRMCLTGTPITNQLQDLYSQLEFLGKGLSGFSSEKTFRQFYHKFVQQGQVKLLTGFQNVPMLQERLTRLSYIVPKSFALPDLPDKVYDIEECAMSPEQYKVYCDVRDKLAVEIEDDLAEADGRNRLMVINNVLTKLLKLAQITSGFFTISAEYNEFGDVTREKSIDRFDPNPKLERLVELLREKGPNEKTLVWACWVQDIKTITARLNLEKIDTVTFYGRTTDDEREIAVDRFNNDPTCKVMVANPAAGGTGLNLRGYNPDDPDSKTNCTHIVYFSQNWSMTARTQSEDRAHRRGTRVNVRITDLCIPGSIDEEIRARVTDKRKNALAVQDVRGILRRLIETGAELVLDK